MNEREALMKAIVSFPDEDTPRLLFAEFLDEQDVRRVTCPLCKKQKVFTVDGWPFTKCGKCGNSGEIIDPAWQRDRDRAELIRLQYTLQDCPTVHTAKTGYGTAWAEMRVRERELLTLHESEWRKSVPCPECKGRGEISVFHPTRCSICHGTGDAGGLCGRTIRPRSDNRSMFEEWEIPVTFRCGFPDQITVPSMEWCVKTIPAHVPVRGVESGAPPTPSDRLRAVCTHHPITRVFVEDANPDTDDGIRFGWHRECDEMSFNPATGILPTWLFDIIPAHKSDKAGTYFLKIWPTRELALTALQRAICQWARPPVS